MVTGKLQVKCCYVATAHNEEKQKQKKEDELRVIPNDFKFTGDGGMI